MKGSAKHSLPTYFIWVRFNVFYCFAEARYVVCFFSPYLLILATPLSHIYRQLVQSHCVFCLLLRSSQTAFSNEQANWIIKCLGNFCNHTKYAAFRFLYRWILKNPVDYFCPNAVILIKCVLLTLPARPTRRTWLLNRVDKTNL